MMKNNSLRAHRWKKNISNSDLKEHFQKDGRDFLQYPQIDDPWKTSYDYQGCKSQAWQTRPSQTSQDFQVDWSGPFRPEILGELGRADDLQPYWWLKQNASYGMIRK